MNNKEDRFFEIIAKKYMEDDGENLRKLSEELNKEAKDLSRLDLRVKKSINRAKSKNYYIASSLVGCALIIFLVVNYSNIFLTGTNEEMSSSDNTKAYSETTEINKDKEYDIQRVASILPVGYEVSDIDYDNTKTIFYVLNDKNDKIVIEEEKTEDIKSDGLVRISLQGKEAYGISKADYSVITFKSGDNLYTMTSAYDAQSLIAIGESILK